MPRRTLVTALSSATASYISRTPRPAPSTETLAAEDFGRRLQRAVRDGAYLILLALPHRVSAVRQKLLADYGLEPRSFDRLFLDALRATADELGIEWSVVLDADAAQPSSRDGRNLRRVIDRALPAVEQALLSTEGTVLLTEPGLLGRYDLIPWLERLRDRLARPEAGRALRGLWLLAPSDEQQEGPRLLDRPVPVVGASEYAWVAESWLTGAHQVNGSTESLGER